MALAALAIAGAAAPATAQSAPPFDFNPERVHYMSVQRCARAGTYIVPALYLYVNARSAPSPLGDARRPKARIHVEGLDKAQLQALARTLYEDFVQKLRANGARVLTFEDIRADAAPFARQTPDAALGLPIRSDWGSGWDYAVAAPSDEQAIDWDRSGVTWPWRALARDRFASVIVPEITFTLPHVGPNARKDAVIGWLAKEAKVSLDPAMIFSSGMMNGMPQDQRWCNIDVQEHTFRLASEAAGRIEKAAQRGNYAFVVDPQAFEAGVLRVGQAFNGLMAEALKGE